MKIALMPRIRVARIPLTEGVRQDGPPTTTCQIENCDELEGQSILGHANACRVARKRKEREALPLRAAMAMRPGTFALPAHKKIGG
jgi:hypothetical protein